MKLLSAWKRLKKPLQMVVNKMKKQITKRLDEFEERIKSKLLKTYITIIDETAEGCKVTESIYHKGKRVAQNVFDIAADTTKEAAANYKEPLSCSDGIVFIKDYGRPEGIASDTLDRLLEMMETEELKKLAADYTSEAEYDRFFDQIMAKYSGRLLCEIGVSQADVQRIEKNMNRE